MGYLTDLKNKPKKAFEIIYHFGPFGEHWQKGKDITIYPAFKATLGSQEMTQRSSEYRRVAREYLKLLQDEHFRSLDILLPKIKLPPVEQYPIFFDKVQQIYRSATYKEYEYILRLQRFSNVSVLIDFPPSRERIKKGCSFLFSVGFSIVNSSWSIIIISIFFQFVVKMPTSEERRQWENEFDEEVDCENINPNLDWQKSFCLLEDLENSNIVDEDYKKTHIKSYTLNK
jgi:hypothetical protein